MIKGRAAVFLAGTLLGIALLAGALSAYQSYSARINQNFEGLSDLHSIDEFAQFFDLEEGKARIVLLVSPTCPVCFAGANWVEKNILDAYPEADIAVFAVWFNMYPGDHQTKWNPKLLDDSRVSHFWDEERQLGNWYASEGAYPYGPIAWDMFIFYAPNSSWDDGVQLIIRSGVTIIREKDLLFDSIFPYLAAD